MAKRKAVHKNGDVNKTSMILNYLKRHPEAKPREVAKSLHSKGVEVSSQYVSTIKSTHKEELGLTGAASSAAAGESAAVKSSRSAKSSAPTFTLESLVQLRKVAEQFGGIDNTIQALDAMKNLR